MTIKHKQLTAAARLLGRARDAAEPSQSQVRATRRAASLLARSQWAAIPAAERSAIMSTVQNGSGGRPRAKERCFCEARSLHSATLRRFDCCKRAGKYPVSGSEKREEPHP